MSCAFVLKWGGKNCELKKLRCNSAKRTRPPSEAREGLFCACGWCAVDVKCVWWGGGLLALSLCKWVCVERSQKGHPAQSMPITVHLKLRPALWKGELWPVCSHTHMLSHTRLENCDDKKKENVLPHDSLLNRPAARSSGCATTAWPALRPSPLPEKVQAWKRRQRKEEIKAKENEMLFFVIS